MIFINEEKGALRNLYSYYFYNSRFGVVIGLMIQSVLLLMTILPAQKCPEIFNKVTCFFKVRWCGLYTRRADTSQRQQGSLPPCPLPLPWCTLKCSSAINLHLPLLQDRCSFMQMKNCLALSLTRAKRQAWTLSNSVIDTHPLLAARNKRNQTYIHCQPHFAGNLHN